MSDKQDRILDEYLKIATEEYLKQVEEENDAIMEKFKGIEYPKSLDTWFENEMSKKRKKDQCQVSRKKVIAFSRRIAVVFAVALILGSILVFSVDAIRVEFLNLFVSETDTYKELQFEENDELLTIASDNNMIYYPKILPDGFKLESFESSESLQRYIFTKGDEVIFLDINKGVSDIRLDNEEGEISDITFGSHQGKINRTKDKITIVIKIDNFVISVLGNSDEEILIKLLENTI